MSKPILIQQTNLQNIIKKLINIRSIISIKADLNDLKFNNFSTNTDQAIQEIFNITENNEIKKIFILLFRKHHIFLHNKVHKTLNKAYQIDSLNLNIINDTRQLETIPKDVNYIFTTTSRIRKINSKDLTNTITDIILTLSNLKSKQAEKI